MPSIDDYLASAATETLQLLLEHQRHYGDRPTLPQYQHTAPPNALARLDARMAYRFNVFLWRALLELAATAAAGHPLQTDDTRRFVTLWQHNTGPRFLSPALSIALQVN